MNQHAVLLLEFKGGYLIQVPICNSTLRKEKLIWPKIWTCLLSPDSNTDDTYDDNNNNMQMTSLHQLKISYPFIAKKT